MDVSLKTLKDSDRLKRIAGILQTMPKESNLQAEEFGNFPLLASIALDPLGKELETRVHKFTRYADDIFLIVKSAKEPQRVWRTTSGFAERPASK